MKKHLGIACCVLACALAGEPCVPAEADPAAPLVAVVPVAPDPVAPHGATAPVTPGPAAPHSAAVPAADPAAPHGAAAPAAPEPPAPDYAIRAIRYASLPGFPVAALVMGAPKDEKTDIAMVIWLIQGGGRTILFDTGFHRDRWTKDFPLVDRLRPDDALRQAGVTPESVTDIIVSHAHWDHMGGIDLFPKAAVWIQEQEYGYYTGEAWQPGGKHGGIDPDDVAALVRLNTEGRVRLVDGDDVEILPGIRVYTGARHTFASQYVLVEGKPPFVLASDNCYLYRNLAERAASATFEESDRAANLAAQERMIGLAGSADRVIPGHDPKQFTRFPTEGRVARIR